MTRRGVTQFCAGVTPRVTRFPSKGFLRYSANPCDMK